eukprot:SAG31_NODE_120_length_23892_cov_10.545623_26_plen_296_part_00
MLTRCDVQARDSPSYNTCPAAARWPLPQLALVGAVATCIGPRLHGSDPTGLRKTIACVDILTLPARMLRPVQIHAESQIQEFVPASGYFARCCHACCLCLPEWDIGRDRHFNLAVRLSALHMIVEIMIAVAGERFGALLVVAGCVSLRRAQGSQASDRRLRRYIQLCFVAAVLSIYLPAVSLAWIMVGDTARNDLEAAFFFDGRPLACIVQDERRNLPGAELGVLGLFAGEECYFLVFVGLFLLKLPCMHRGIDCLLSLVFMGLIEKYGTNRESVTLQDLRSSHCESGSLLFAGG